VAFLTPIFLLGAMAAALPVLVHLVRRTRARKEPFPSLMFLRRIEQKTIRKRTLRNLLLLLLRCLALLLLALAFARPYFPQSNSLASGADAPSSVVLVDHSYSMRYGDVFGRALQAARNIISEAAPNEQIALVSFSEGYEIVAPLKASNAEARALVEQLKPGLGSTDYLQALQSGDAILKDASGRRRIYLISDFQDPGWNRSAPPFKLSPGIELVPIDVSDTNPANLAVSDIKAEPVVYTQKYPGKVVARASNFSDEAKEVPVEFKLNDLTVERRQVALEAGGSQMVEFSDFNVTEGSNRATIEVSGDVFGLDDKGFFTINRDDQTRVLAIETAGRGRSESFFIQQSLLAGENNQHSLVVKTAGTVNPAELGSYRVVIVNDVGGLNEQLAGAIKEFVERGGGLVLVAGKHTDAASFNRLFSAVSPAELGEVVQTRGGYALMSQVKTDHPVFSLFAQSGRLTSTRVYAYHRAVPGEKSSVVAALDDGSPIVVEGTAGTGKVLFVSTTLDTAWSDLPLTPMFLPLIRQMLEYLGGRTASSWYTIGQVFTAPADPDGSLPSIQNPGGSVIEERKTPAGELMVSATEIGFYRLRYRDRVENLAVNLDARESDLTKLGIDDLVAAVTPEGGVNQPLAERERLSPGEIEARQRIWLPLLIAALGLFVLEAVMARRIRIARMAG
jgi:hypothetical protein